ncbi:MAG: ATPase [Bacteroidia bacterium]|nr:ATPase [Bacteroidia bacterium]
MKKALILAVTLFVGLGASAKSVVTEFKVKGQCGDCKERIEKALDVQGISFAIWDKETKMLTVRYNNKRFSEDDIHKMISDIGYATSKMAANKEAESKLPKCCQPGSVCEHEE